MIRVPKTPQTIARHAEIVARAMSGESRKSLAKEYGWQLDTIGRIIRDAGNTPPTDSAYTDYAERALKVAAELAWSNVPEILSPLRNQYIAKARFAVMEALRQRGANSYQIGRMVNRDHSTVSNGLERADYYAARCPKFAQMLALVVAA